MSHRLALPHPAHVLLANERDQRLTEGRAPAELIVRAIEFVVSWRVAFCDQNVSHSTHLGNAITFERAGLQIESQRLPGRGSKLLCQPSCLRSKGLFDKGPALEIKVRAGLRQDIPKNIWVGETDVGSLQSAQTVTAYNRTPGIRTNAVMSLDPGDEFFHHK